MMDAYRKDSVFRDSIDLITAQVAGAGFYTTCTSEEKYEQAGKAKEIVDEFNRQNNLDSMLQTITKEVVATGSSIAEKVTPKKIERLQYLPIYTFDKVITNEVGRFEETDWTRKKSVKMGYKQLTKYGGKTISPDAAIHFCWNPVDDSGWGCGIMRTALETYTWVEENKTTKQWEEYTRRSIYDMKASIDEQLIEIITKFAGPLEAWIAKRKADAEELTAKLQAAPKRGARIVTTGEIDIKTPALAPQVRFDPTITYLFNLVCLAGQTPLPRLFTERGYTEASANIAKEVGNLIVQPIKRMIKREIETVWDQVILQEKMDPVKAAVRLNWGIEEKPEVRIEDLIKLAEISATTGVQYIRPEELRKNLIKFGFELWEQEQLGERPR